MTAPNDTKTTLLPAARLAEIRLRDSGEETAEAIADYDQPTIDRRALLAHLDALTAELAEARATAERWKVACERQEQANASADREDDKRVARARREGAREEREAIETFLRAEIRNSERAGQAEEERALYDALEWVRARGDATPVEGEDGGQ